MEGVGHLGMELLVNIGTSTAVIRKKKLSRGVPLPLICQCEVDLYNPKLFPGLRCPGLSFVYR